jgi:hypothetical protein
MSHRHFCDFAGYYWECQGTALQLPASVATICRCVDHGVPVEDGNQSLCTIELLACPDDRIDQMRVMGHERTVCPRCVGKFPGGFVV